MFLRGTTTADLKFMIQQSNNCQPWSWRWVLQGTGTTGFAGATCPAHRQPLTCHWRFPVWLWLVQQADLSLDTSNRTCCLPGLMLARATTLFSAFLHSALEQSQTNRLPGDKPV